MKKRLLFVMPNMDIGGSVRNFISLVNLLDPDQYEITLQLFNRKGVLLEQIPEHIQILEFPSVFSDFQLPWQVSLGRLIPKHPHLAVLRVIRLLAGFFPSFRRNVSQREWIFLRRLLPAHTQEYDVAIGFLQTVSIYYIVEKVNAAKKIGFVRNEYSAGQYDSRFDNGYFALLDYIGAVSQAGVDDLQSVFPQYREKIRLIPNVVSPEFCRAMAVKEDNPSFSQVGIHLVSVGRLVKVKGFDMAIEALRILRGKGYPVFWHLIGTGPEMSALTKQAADAGVREWFLFAGEQANPYPFILRADVYVQTSRSEGWCISLQEAMVLGKAVVSTDFPSALEQVENGRTGLICTMDPESIAEAVQALLDSPDLRRSIESHVQSIPWDPYKPLKSFFRIIEA